MLAGDARLRSIFLLAISLLFLVNREILVIRLIVTATSHGTGHGLLKPLYEAIYR